MRTRRALAAVSFCALLAVPAPAAARTYGGSFMITDWPLVVEAGPRSVDSATMFWVARCPGGALIGSHGSLPGSAARTAPGGFGFYNARLVKNRFRAKLYGAADWGPNLHGTISGTFGGTLGKTFARGFLAGTVTYTDSENVERKCYIGPERWYAANDPLVYAGTTAEDEPIVFRLNKARSAVVETSLGWTTRNCRSGSSNDVADRLGRMPLTSHSLLQASPFEALTYSDGTHSEFSYRLQGTFERTAAHGTLAVGARFRDSSGQETDSCPGMQEAWHAVQT